MSSSNVSISYITEENTSQVVHQNNGNTALYVGAIVSIVFSSVGLLSFAINRSHRVKRQYIISINLCFSLLVFYIGFLIGLINEDMGGDSTTGGEMIKPSCTAGAIMVFAGWFFVLFWLLIDWIYLSFIIQQRVSKHVSHFFIKSAIPAYGTALVILIVVVALDAAYTKSYVDPVFCWYRLEAKVEIVFFSAITICTVAIIGCAIFCCVVYARKESKNTIVSSVKKNKRSLICLTVLTMIIYVTSIVHLILWFVKTERSRLSHEEVWLKNLDGAFTSLQTVSVVICLAFRTDEFRRFITYWTSVVKGDEDPVLRNTKALHSTLRSSKRTSNNHSTSEVPEVPEPEERTAIRFEPRDQHEIKLTHDDEVFLASSKYENMKSPTTPEASAPQIKGTKQPVAEETDITGTLPRLSTLKRKMTRSSSSKPKKSSVTSYESLPRSPLRSTLTLNRFIYNRNSRISMNGDHERKSSF